MVSMLLLDAHKLGASDIHLEPLEKSFRVRFRIDGVLQEMQSPPKKLQSAIISRLKIMTGSMSIAEKRLPQDGRIQVKMGKKSIDLRVSTMPTNHGESMVMRLLDKSSLLLGLPELGFLSDDQETSSACCARRTASCSSPARPVPARRARSTPASTTSTNPTARSSRSRSRSSIR